MIRIDPVAGQSVNSERIAHISLGRKLNRLAIVDMPQIEDGTMVIFR